MKAKRSNQSRKLSNYCCNRSVTCAISAGMTSPNASNLSMCATNAVEVTGTWARTSNLDRMLASQAAWLLLEGVADDEDAAIPLVLVRLRPEDEAAAALGGMAAL